MTYLRGYMSEEVNDKAEKAEGMLELNEENIRALWSKTYNTEGKPDWSHLFPYYHHEIVFQDTIQRIEGFEAFSAMCKRLTERSKKLRFDILSFAKRDDLVLMEWKMTMSFRKFPDTPIYGSTRLTIGPDGRITYQRDYYDLWGDIFNGIPGFGKMYRRFMRRYFG